MPAVDVPAYMADKMAKAASAFAIKYHYIFLHLFIAFYIATENWGTIWAPKHWDLLQFQMR